MEEALLAKCEEIKKLINDSNKLALMNIQAATDNQYQAMAALKAMGVPMDMDEILNGNK